MWFPQAVRWSLNNSTLNLTAREDTTFSGCDLLSIETTSVFHIHGIQYASATGGKTFATQPGVVSEHVLSDLELEFGYHDIWSAPVDGKEKRKVWFCSSCFQGPYGIWQNICTECEHQKCSHCRVEITK